MALINKTKVKELTKFQVSEEFCIELEKQIEELIKKAEIRARENSRRTLLKRDL
jgi:histone H3/H4